MKNLFFCLFGITLLVIGGCTDDFDTPNDTPQFEYSPSYGVKFVDQNKAINAHKQLFESFDLKMKSTSGEGCEYPDYYGGCYIDENQKLVVYVKDVPSLRSSSIDLNNDVIEKKTCTYSYNELIKIQKQVLNYVSNTTNIATSQNVVAVSIMSKENLVKVGLLDCSDQKIKEFKENIADSPAVIFERAEIVEPYYVLDPGSYISTTSGSFSTGYRAMGQYNADGFVTAAHAVKQVGVGIYNSSRELLGTSYSLKYGGTVDAAFIRSSTLADMTNYIPGTGLRYKQTSLDPIVGLVIYKIGQATSISSGNITSDNSAYMTSDRVWLSQQAGAAMVATQGDSGGLVYYNSGGGLATVCGIIQGGISGITYFTTEKNINSELGVTLY